MIKSRQRIHLSIGIPAYNAEKNIDRLVNSLLEQKQKNYILDALYVYSDKSSDQTNRIVEGIENSLVKLLIAKKRRGFASALISLTYVNTSEILVVLNDDIIIIDPLFINKAIKPFIKSNNIGLVCCNTQALPSNVFISEAVR